MSGLTVSHHATGCRSCNFSCRKFTEMQKTAAETIFQLHLLEHAKLEAKVEEQKGLVEKAVASLDRDEKRKCELVALCTYEYYKGKSKL